MTLGHKAALALRRYALPLSLTLMTVDCDRIDLAAGSVTVRDSAGVAIVENRSNGPERLAWLIDDTAMVDIGRAEGDGPDVFGSVRQVIRLRTGGLAVADAAAREIRVFDEDGRHEFTLGRQGEGPGEFATLGLIVQVRGDSVAAIDNLLGRVSVFSSGGEFGRSYPIPRLEGGSAPNVLGFLDTGEMVVVAPATAAAAPQSTVLLYTVDPEGTIVHRHGAYPDRERGSNGLGLAFGGAAIFGVGASNIWSAHTSTFEFRAADAQGKLIRIIRLDRSPRTVTDAEVAEAKASVEENFRRQGVSGPAVARILATEFASRHPVMARILVDDAEQLWVSRYTNTMVAERPVSEQREIWDVFAPDGGRLGSVTLPAGFRADAVSVDLVVGVHTDESGVQRVRAHRISRP